MSRSTQLLLGGSVLFLIDSFLPWNRACVEGIVNVCASANAWHRFGFLAGLLAIAIIVLEVMAIMGTDVSMPKGTVALSLAGALLVSVILRILMDNEFISWGAWVGLVLAIAVAYGGWLRYQEAPSTTAGPTAPPPAS